MSYWSSHYSHSSELVTCGGSKDLERALVEVWLLLLALPQWTRMLSTQSSRHIVWLARSTSWWAGYMALYLNWGQAPWRWFSANGWVCQGSSGDGVILMKSLLRPWVTCTQSGDCAFRPLHPHTIMFTNKNLCNLSLDTAALYISKGLAPGSPVDVNVYRYPNPLYEIV